MFKRVQQFLLILFMFQFVLGSTAWMYSSHFCKMEDGCDELTVVSCCADEVNVEALEVPSAEESCCPPSSAQSCCFEINPYINFPVYRIIKTELPGDHFMVASLIQRSVEVLGGNILFERNQAWSDFTNADSSPPDKLILMGVFRI